MECRQSGLTDHQWCVEHDIKPGILQGKGCVRRLCGFASVNRTQLSCTGKQEVVRVDFMILTRSNMNSH
ncbi:hypothetical protein [Faecalimonas umbilicata]|uniref:hypothetical protein n=1 Tax=Faecalimonas umbilicata TaxID=1912855 RepID=UPI003992F461